MADFASQLALGMPRLHILKLKLQVGMVPTWH